MFIGENRSIKIWVWSYQGGLLFIARVEKLHKLIYFCLFFKNIYVSSWKCFLDPISWSFVRY